MKISDTTCRFVIVLFLIQSSRISCQNSSNEASLIASSIQQTLAGIACAYIGVGSNDVPCATASNLAVNRFAQIQSHSSVLNLPNYINALSQDISSGFFKPLWSQFFEISTNFQQTLKYAQTVNTYNGSNTSCFDLPSGAYSSVPQAAEINCAIIPSLAQFLASIAQQPFVRLQYASILGDHLVVNAPGSSWENITVVTDTSDPRTLSWFVSASASRRDIIFILDMSPSVRMNSDSNTSTTMLMALRACLSMLAPLDFYQVLIGGYTDPSQPNLLLRATADSRAASARWVESTLADNLSPLTEGLGTNAIVSAWNILLDSAAAGSTNGCLRTVVMITDGVGSEDNDPVADVARVQALAFAQVWVLQTTAEPCRTCTDLACANSGAHVQLPPLAPGGGGVAAALTRLRGLLQAASALLYADTNPEALRFEGPSAAGVGGPVVTLSRGVLETPLGDPLGQTLHGVLAADVDFAQASDPPPPLPPPRAAPLSALAQGSPRGGGRRRGPE